MSFSIIRKRIIQLPKKSDARMTFLLTCTPLLLILTPPMKFSLITKVPKRDPSKMIGTFCHLRRSRIPRPKKPEDWDDRAKIDDAEDTKPEDWDQPEHVADPDATKPEDWDDEMDGEWEPPMIDNPDYKGEWKARQIDNPDYKGKWIHPEIDNPEYNADDAKTLGKYDEVCKIGFDLWQVKSGTIFDNVLITDDIAEAKRIGDETWGATKNPEKAMKDEQDEVGKKKAEEEAAAAGAGADEDEDLDDEDLDDLDDEEDEPKEEHDEL